MTNNSVVGIVTVIDELRLLQSCRKQSLGIAVNPITNKVCVANNGSADVTVIDGATNSATTVPSTGTPFAEAANPLTTKSM